MADDDFEMVSTPGSSQVASVGYKSDTQKLRVEFTSGALYEYSDVPEAVHAAMMHAPSVGGAFHSLIRNGGYPCQRLS